MSCWLDMKSLVEKHIRGSVGEWCEQEKLGRGRYKGKCNYFSTDKDAEVTSI